MKFLPSRQCLNKVDYCIGRHGVAELVAIAHLAPIDEGSHVLAKLTLIVEHITARLLVYAKVALEHVRERAPLDFARGTRDVPLNVLRES
jgi:hypothetical protein